MTASYLTTDIVVIVVLVIILGSPYLFQFFKTFVFLFKNYILVIIGVCAFLVHFYWTKIGVAEIWNTVKWSSMRSSFYRTINRFGRRTTSKYVDDEALSAVSIRSDDLDDVSIQKKKSTPMITSYHTPANVSLGNKPVSVIAYNNPPPRNHGRRISRSIDNTQPQNSQYNDLASAIQKQYF
jgi:hypothetical protein